MFYTFYVCFFQPHDINTWSHTACLKMLLALNVYIPFIQCISKSNLQIRSLRHVCLNHI